MLQVKLSNWV